MQLMYYSHESRLARGCCPLLVMGDAIECTNEFNPKVSKADVKYCETKARNLFKYCTGFALVQVNNGWSCSSLSTSRSDRVTP